MALHKLIRMVTMALGGEGWLNFMGNEFGHPEWLDFPREGNGWSHQHCRRQWSLVDTEHMRYVQLNAWDKAMQELDDKYGFLSSKTQWVTHIDQERHVLVAERGPLVFVFNFHPHDDYEGLKVAAPEPGKYLVAMDSDAWCFGGQGRIHWDAEHFTTPATEEEGGRFHERDQYFQVMAPARTVVAYVREERQWRDPAQQQQQRHVPDAGAGGSSRRWGSEDGGDGGASSSGGGGRFSSYISQRQQQQQEPPASWRRSGGSSDDGNGGGSGSGGRFAAYIKQREQGSNGNGSYSNSNGNGNGSSSYSNGDDGGRFAKYLRRRS